MLLTLEDMAVYLTQEEWRCLDLARQGHGCGVLPEDEGNVRRDPGFVHQTLCCVSDLGESQGGWRSPRAGCGAVVASRPRCPGQLLAEHLPWLHPTLQEWVQ